MLFRKNVFLFVFFLERGGWGAGGGGGGGGVIQSLLHKRILQVLMDGEGLQLLVTRQQIKTKICAAKYNLRNKYGEKKCCES